MKNILFPTDFSKAADLALDYTIMLAKEINAKITLVHVPQIFSDYSLFYNNEFHSLLEEKDLNAILQEYVDSKNVNCIKNYFVLNGNKNISDIVIEYANSNDIDLICIGSRGENSILKMVMGSTSYAIQTSADIPVLCIPDSIIYENVKNVVFATDFQNFSDEAFDFSLALNSILKSMLHIVDVNVANNPLLIENQKELEGKYHSENLKFKIIEGNEIVEPLVKYSTQENANILIINTKKRNFFSKLFERSYSEEIIETKTIPVLVTKF